MVRGTQASSSTGRGRWPWNLKMEPDSPEKDVRDLMQEKA